jgi:predicted Zn-ribbon and HTH transcriptional regulator
VAGDCTRILDQYTKIAEVDSRLFIDRPFAYDHGMSPIERTSRQRLIELLTGTMLSSHQLAPLLGIPERQVEEHLTHIVKTIARDPSRTFLLEPSECLGCGFTFRDRTRLTRPSRCPHCRNEAITAPRYGIREERETSPESHKTA